MPTNLGLDEGTAGRARSSVRPSVTKRRPRLPKTAGAREHKLGATARSFAILEHVASSRRLVDWFISQGYLSREPGRRRLIVGPKLTNLAFGALSSSMRHDTPHVVLQRLVRTLK